MSSTKKILAVEGIRGLASLVVVFSHLMLTFFPYVQNYRREENVSAPFQEFLFNAPLGFLYTGTSAVFVFFVLSGYILTNVALVNGGSISRIKKMAIKRYPRLMLPTLAACLFAYLSFHIMPLPVVSLDQWINNYVGNFDYSFWGAVYSGVIGTFLEGKSPYSIVLWTMQVELVGSFFVYLLCFNRVKWQIPYFAAITFMLIIILVILRLLPIYWFISLAPFYGGYAMSCYGKNVRKLTAVLLLIIGFYFAGAHQGSFSYAWLNDFGSLGTSLATFMSGFFIVYAIIFNQNLSNALNRAWVEKLGEWSYSLYLCHISVIAVASVYTFIIVEAVTHNYVMAAMTAFVMTIPYSLATSELFLRFIDRPTLKVCNEIADRLIKSA